MQRLNQDIKTGQLNHIYLLYGEEAYLQKQYRDRLKAAIIGDDTMNYHYYEGKNLSVGEVIDQAETMPFFADKRLIVLENTGLFKSGGEELAEYLKNQPRPFTLFWWRKRWISAASFTKQSLPRDVPWNLAFRMKIR